MHVTYRNEGCGTSWFVDDGLAEGVFVVVHPHLEHMALDAHGGAEVVHGGFIVLLDAPAEFGRERVHLVLLFGGEFGAEALLDDGGSALVGEVHGHAGAGAGAGGGGGGGGVVEVVEVVAVGRCRGGSHRERRDLLVGS